MGDDAERAELIGRIKKAGDDHRNDRRRLVEQLERKTHLLLVCDALRTLATDALHDIAGAEDLPGGTVKKCSARATAALEDMHKRRGGDDKDKGARLGRPHPLSLYDTCPTEGCDKFYAHRGSHS